MSTGSRSLPSHPQPPPPHFTSRFIQPRSDIGCLVVLILARSGLVTRPASLRNESGIRAYIVTARRMVSGLVSTYGTGRAWPLSDARQHQGRPQDEVFRHSHLGLKPDLRGPGVTLHAFYPTDARSSQRQFVGRCFATALPGHGLDELLHQQAASVARGAACR